MTVPPTERRYVVERRLVSDRRRGLERRVAERRVQFRWVEAERRMVSDRRRGSERRHLVPRRKAKDRRLTPA